MVIIELNQTSSNAMISKLSTIHTDILLRKIRLYGHCNVDIIGLHCRNLLCGMLHCKHLNERLEFGMESVATLSHSFINNGGKIIPCRSAIVDLGLNQVDPGLAPDGAKCAPGKV